MHTPSTTGLSSLLGWMLVGRLAVVVAAVPGPELRAAAREEWEKDIASLEACDAAESHPADGTPSSKREVALIKATTAQLTADNPPASRIPLIYCTDLFHPHDDPDDHFDLATLHAIPEFDVRGIVLDQGALQVSRPGSIPVAQLNAVTGRRIPASAGLTAKLAAPTDPGLDQPEPFQGGIRMILLAGHPRGSAPDGSGGADPVLYLRAGEGNGRPDQFPAATR